MSDTIYFKKSLTSKKKYVEIIDLIKHKIINQEIKPGDRLPSEVQFIEELGISRTPVREALKILEAMGVITIKRGEGIYLSRPMDVAKLNPLVFDLMMLSHQTDKLVEFRQCFENMVLDLARKNCQEKDFINLEAHIKKQEDLLQKVDIESWTQLDLDFHFIILRSTENPFMISIGYTVYELYRSHMPRLSSLSKRKDTVNTHKAYIEMLKAPNTEVFMKLKSMIEKNYSNSII